MRTIIYISSTGGRPYGHSTQEQGPAAAFRVSLEPMHARIVRRLDSPCHLVSPRRRALLHRTSVGHRKSLRQGPHKLFTQTRTRRNPCPFLKAHIAAHRLVRPYTGGPGTQHRADQSHRCRATAPSERGKSKRPSASVPACFTMNRPQHRPKHLKQKLKAQETYLDDSKEHDLPLV